MNLRDAYRLGYDTGYGIGVENLASFTDRDEFISEVCQTESEHYRQFSPFEFTAKEFNESRDPDRTWEEYERGVAAGAKAAWKKAA